MLNEKYEKTDDRSTSRSQLRIYLAFLLVYAALVFLTYALFPMQEIAMGAALPEEMGELSAYRIGLMNAAVALFGYGLLGLAGYWLARQMSMVGIYRHAAGWHSWLWSPLLIGIGLGIIALVIDSLFQIFSGSDSTFAHPGFPLSIFASATAGIGEEIIFRGFVLVLWAYLLHRLLRRRHLEMAFWAANLIAALAFAAGHIPSVMVILGIEELQQIPSWLLWEGFILNGMLSIVAGWRYRHHGLVAAIGIHFWFDVVWHVIWPLLA